MDLKGLAQTATRAARFLAGRRDEVNLLKHSRFFDSDWYATRYGVKKEDAVKHYLTSGWKQGFWPCAYFDPQSILQRWPQATQTAPLLYFERIGFADLHYLYDKFTLRKSSMMNASWYKRAYCLPKRVSAYDHYLLYGCAHGFSASRKFSSIRYLLANPDVLQAGVNPLLHYIRNGYDEGRTGVESTDKRKMPQTQYNEACALQNKRMAQTFDKQQERVVVYIVPDTDQISGGVMAICNYCSEIRDMPELKNAAVLIATNTSPYNTFADFTMFDAKDHIYRFSQLRSYFTNLRSLVLHIPDCEIVNFIDRISGDEIAWLQSIPDVQINLLNQNNEIMPAPSVCDLLRPLCARLTMTCAHIAYATAQQRSTYNVDVHFIPAVKNVKYHVKPFGEKENLLVLSPDRHPQREAIVNKILEAFPGMRVVEIWNTPFDEYLELIGKAMWVISFGEGFDGYTIESLYSGTVSFTLFNDVFFSPGFVPWPNMFTNVGQMQTQIVDMMKSLSEPKAYYAFLDKVTASSNSTYTGYDYRGSLARFYKGEYDCSLDLVEHERKERMLRRPLVSVVMATHQAEEYLREQLDSIMTQTYGNIELLIYDRASTDGTVAIADAYTTAIFEKGEAIGQNQALLRLIAKAKGEFIAIADQDDVWERDKIEWLVEHIDGDAVCFSNAKEIGGSGSLPEGDGLWQTKKREKLVTLKDCLRPERCAPACTMLITRDKAMEAAELVGEELPLSWWIFLHTLLFGGGCHFTDHVTVHMRNHLGKALRAQLAAADENLPAVMNRIRSVYGDRLDVTQKKELILCRNGARMRSLLNPYFKNGLKELFDVSGALFSDEMLAMFREDVIKCL